MSGFKNNLPLLVFTILFLFGCGGQTNSGMSDETSIKKHIDESYEKINGKYKELCARPRNDFLKNEFDKLRTDIAEVRSISEALINLDYQKQKEISDYSEKKLETYSALYKLADYSEIECW